MQFEDRVRGVAQFDFTERQARFLVTVMLHSGVCLPRQYAAFAGIVEGQKTRRFFAKLIRLRYASAYPCRHNRARIYQVHNKALYRAIGETDSSHRRPLSPARVVERLMLIDALLADREFSPGTYSLQWNARGEAGGALGSGLYFLRLSGPGFSTQTARLALAR